MALLIKNGCLIDPATQTNGVYDILIEDGHIKEIAPEIRTNELTEIINASGLIVSPGFIDIHVHLREPGQEHKEDIETGSRAAVHGGFTSIACMPNTTPVNDNLDVTQHIIKRAKEVGLLNIFPIAAISKNLESQVLTDMENLVHTGVRGFSDDGRCVMSEAIFREALIKARDLRVPIIEHPEDHSISLDGQVNEGEISRACHLKGIPAASEDVIIERDIRLQEEIRSFLHLTHISTEGAVRLLADAKKRHIPVTCDVTPHHLLLEESAVAGGDSLYKMKPPLRSTKDREAVIKGIQEGIIDCIATDHAPHSREEKNRPFAEAPFGITGIETVFSIVYDRLVKPGAISLEQLIRLMSTHPAQIMHLTDRGVVKPGVPADITILNLEEPFKISIDDFCSRSVNSPFIGWEGEGVIEYTIVNGTVVYRRL